MFKKRANVSSFIRKRKTRGSGSSSDDDTKVMKISKKTEIGNPLVQKTNFSKSKNNVIINSDSDDDILVSFKSKKTADREGPRDMGATSTIQIDTDKSHDSRAIFEKSIEINKQLKGQADDKVYRGLNNYTQFFEKRDSAQGSAASAAVTKGPIRAPDNIRSTVRWDYQPDLCKDYKETGFCGFGDSCKFLHDRTDYKFGWQLEVETEKNKKQQREDNDSDDYEIPSDDEYLPFKCLFCRNSFVDPVVTKCKHYYCEKCALSCYSKSKKCYVCSKNTGGVFVPAKEIIARLNSDDKDEKNDNSSSDSG